MATGRPDAAAGDTADAPRSPFKALYDLHSWLGLACGLILYVICFAGVLALFTRELGPWQRGETDWPTRLTLAAFDGAMTRALDGMPATAPRSVQVIMPTPYSSVLTIRVRGNRGAPERIGHFDPATGQETTYVKPVAADVLTRLHTDLLLPQPFGRYLVGLLGLAMVASVISGLILHRKFIREFFVLRLGQSRRLLWTDLHKSIGLWGLPFHLVMALSGTILGVVGLALPLASAVAFKGDLDAATRAMAEGPGPAAAVAPAATIPASRAIAAARDAYPALVPCILSIRGYGTDGARIQVMGDVPGALAYYPWVTLDGVSGEVLSITDWSRETAGRLVYAMVTPLHYGSFGGLGAKILYALMGAGTCAVILSGLLIWRTRWSADGAAPTGAAVIWDRLIQSVGCGLPFASVLLLIACRLLPPGPSGSEPVMTGLLLAIWAAAAVQVWRHPPVQAGRDILRVTGGVLLLFPIISWYDAGRHLFDVIFAGGLATVSVDIVAALIGAGLLIALRRQSNCE